MTATLHKPVPTLAEVWARLGDVPPNRILFDPPPGTAVEEDVVRLHDREKLLVELIDGILVEKPMGFLESTVAVVLSRMLGDYVEAHDLGVVAGEAGMMRLAAGLVRIPDVSVVLWGRLPGRRIPTEPIPDLAPDLAVEVLSTSNTAGEMRRKIEEYFAARCRCVWLVDPRARTLSVYSSPQEHVQLSGDDVATASGVLPDFQLGVAELFRRAGLG